MEEAKTELTKTSLPTPQELNHFPRRKSSTPPPHPLAATKTAR